MIDFNYETEFTLDNEETIRNWISNVIVSEGKKVGEINYIFCDDQYLLQINQEHLQHDYYTDIISFDYTLGNELSGDMFISIERVKENAVDFDVSFDEELRRVIVHGVMHYCGYKDISEEDKRVMRVKEDEKLAMFHVEQ
jgi:rRNA maturation RNase YbeY